MKFIKIIAMVLLVAMIGCSFIACDSDKDTDKGSSSNENVTIPKPEGDPTEALGEVKVSFDIKNSAGENIYHVTDYTHRDLDLTVISVVERYVKVNAGSSISFDDNGALKTIDAYTAEKGQTWYILKGTQFNDQNGNVLTAIQLAKALEIFRLYYDPSIPADQLEIASKDKANYDIGSFLNSAYMSTISSRSVLKDGDSFTVILAGKPVAEETPEA